jgi:plastocyanin
MIRHDAMHATPRMLGAVLALLFVTGFMVAGQGLARQSLAADEVELTVTIKDHKFEPAAVKVPAGKAIKLTVNNTDSSAEEFESKTLKVEKVIAGNSSALIRLKPLTKGTYKFFGEYHEKTAQGVLIAE